MNAAAQSMSMTRSEKYRSRVQQRGYLMLELMAVLAITALVLSMAAALLSRTWRTHRAAAADADRAMAFDQVTTVLRRDVTQAPSLRVSADTLELGPAVTWTIAGSQLRRRDAVSQRSFDVRAPATFAAAPGGAQLAIGQSDVPATHVTFVSPVAWASEVRP